MVKNHIAQNVPKMKIELCDRCSEVAIKFEGATIKVWQHTEENKGKVPWGKTHRLCQPCYNKFKKSVI